MPGPENVAGDLIVSLSNEDADLMRALDSAPDDDARHRALLKRRDQRDSARSLLAQDRSVLIHPMAVPALATSLPTSLSTPEGREAADLILKEHICDESLVCAFAQLEQSESDLALEILRAAYRWSPHPQVKAHAGFSLACLLKTRCRASRLGATWRLPALIRLKPSGSSRRSRRHYPDVHVGQGMLAALARSELDEIHSLSVGNIAPEIAGEDTDGQPMQLSDYRGKVVVLTFWGNWCSLCRSMFPYERLLVDRMRGRPFVLLGVNSDNGTAIPQSLAQDKTVTWRSWRDGGEVHGGAIARRWNVQPLPDIFILDDRGVIRHHVGPHSDDHGPLYLLDAHGQLQHRWQARSDEVLEVAEALVREIEGRNSVQLSNRE